MAWVIDKPFADVIKVERVDGNVWNNNKQYVLLPDHMEGVAYSKAHEYVLVPIQKQDLRYVMRKQFQRGDALYSYLEAALRGELFHGKS